MACLIFTMIAVFTFTSCEKEELSLNSQYFIGQWKQEYQFWNLIDPGTDTMINTYVNQMEFFDNGTSLQITPQGQFEYDWFYREIPRQIYFTKVNQPWPSDELYDITEMAQNSQTWERRIQISPDKVALYKFILTRE